MPGGYVKLWRKSLEGGWLEHPKLWTLWCWCLMMAQHKRKKHILKGVEVVLKPGQFVFGQRQLASELKMTRQETRARLTTLENAGNLTIKSTHHYSIGTIINWDIYQENEKENNPQVNPQSTHNQPINKKVKKERKTNTSDFAEIYAHYVHVVQPLRKTKTRCIRNLQRHSKNHSVSDLKTAVENYASTLNGSEPRFRKDPANFFGVNEPYFEDYLPENFDPPEHLKPPKEFKYEFAD